MSFSPNLTAQFNTLSEFVISPSFVWIWCSLTILYAFNWVLKLYWESGGIKRQLSTAIKIISNAKSSKELVSNFQNIQKDLLSLKKVRQPWVEYSQSLLKLPVEHNEKDVSDENFDIKATREAQEYFNDQSMIQPYLDMRTLTVVPTHLSGLGILGTFCGLSCGIYLARHGLAGGEMDEIQHGLAQLLSGASLAFWTSIVGVFSSLLFSKIERGAIKNIQNKIASLNSCINSQFNVVSLEQLNGKSLRQNIQQNNLLAQISEGITAMHRDRSNTNEKVLKEIANEFHKIMTASAGQEIKHIAEAFKQIHYGLKETRESLNMSGKYLLESMETGTKIFKKNLHEISHQFQGNFHSTNEVIQNTFKGVAKEISHTLHNSSLEMSEAIKKPSNELGESLKQLNNKVQQASESWAKSTERNTEYTSKVMENQVKLTELVGPLINASHGITSACEMAQSSLHQSATSAEKISTAVKQMEGISKNLQYSWETYCKRFEGVDQNLGHIFQQTYSSLHQYTDKVKNFTTDLDRHMSKGVLTLAGAVGDLHHTLGSLPDVVKKIKQESHSSIEGHGASYAKNREFMKQSRT